MLWTLIIVYFYLTQKSFFNNVIQVISKLYFFDFWTTIVQGLNKLRRKPAPGALK